MREGSAISTLVACVDVGSTYTKVAVVDVAGGELVATAAHPTTAGTDVLDGLDAAVAGAAARLGADLPAVYACSSAGGGLRLAVVGYEPLVTAEAGQRVGLSAGARVVHVAAGRLDAAGLAAVRAARPDVVLLVGGTDGGEADTLLHNASELGRARSRLAVPVVVAGNAEAREAAVQALAGRGVPVVGTGNVLPRIGELNPQPARTAIREMFLRHVIGGKGLSRGPRFAGMLRGATPDIVLTAVELLAADTAGDLVVVDVGGATTDVYSVVTADGGRQPEAAGTLWHSRTVEGDLGVRLGAAGVVTAARAEGLLPAGAQPALADAAAARAEDPGYLPASGADREVDLRLAVLAVTVALRRHARGEAVTRGGPRRGGRDLSGVRLVVGSGGVLRHAAAGRAVGVLDAALGDRSGGWPLPRRATTVIDSSCALAAGGLLAADHPAAAVAVLRRYLCGG